MAKIQRSWIVVIAIVAGLADVAITHRVMAATVEEIALMKSADRQKLLVEGARKRESFLLHDADRRSSRPASERRFRKRVSFLQVEFFRGNAERMVQKMLAEYQARDMTSISSTARRRRPWCGARIYTAILFANLADIRPSSKIPRLLGIDQSLFLRLATIREWSNRTRCRRPTRICSIRAGKGR